MSGRSRVVVSGAGICCALGIGLKEVADALGDGRCGLKPISGLDIGSLPIRHWGALPEPLPRLPKRLRKSRKLMSHEAEMAVIAGLEAITQAGLFADDELVGVQPDRVGVICGADIVRLQMDEFESAYTASVIREGDQSDFDFDLFATKGIFETFPLAFLKNLPNLLASHLSIALDARGPNNTSQARASASLLSVYEAIGVLRRDQADVMLAGGSSSRLHPLDLARACLCEEMATGDDATMRPFDRNRSGTIRGEGSALLTLETYDHAHARGANVLAEVLGMGVSMTGPQENPGDGMRRAIRWALEEAGKTPQGVGHVHAQGMATIEGDATEASVIRDTLGEDCPVFAASSRVGHCEAAAGAIATVASLWAFDEGIVPITIGLEELAEDCPVEVMTSKSLLGALPTAMIINQTREGQAVALFLGRT